MHCFPCTRHHILNILFSSFVVTIHLRHFPVTTSRAVPSANLVHYTTSPCRPSRLAWSRLQSVLVLACGSSLPDLAYLWAGPSCRWVQKTPGLSQCPTAPPRPLPSTHKQRVRALPVYTRSALISFVYNPLSYPRPSGMPVSS